MRATWRAAFSGAQRLPFRGDSARLFVVWALASLSFWSPLWIVYLQAEGLDLAAIGLLEASGLLIQIGLAIPAGLFIDHIGRRRAIVYGAVISGVGVFLLAATVGSIGFYIGFILHRVSAMLINGAIPPLLYETMVHQGRREEYPKFAGRFTAILEAGGAVAGLVAGLLAQGPGLIWGFVLSGVGMFVAAAVGQSLTHGDARQPNVTRTGLYAFVDAVSMLRANRALTYQLLFGAVVTSGSYFLLYILIQPLSVGVGVSVAALGVLLAVLRLASVAGALGAHMLIARVGSRAAVVVSAAALLAAPMPLVVFPHAAVIPVLALAAIGRGLIGPILSLELNKEVSANRRATILGVGSTVTLLVLVAVQPIVLSVLGSMSPAASVLCSLVIFGLPAGVLLLAWRRERPPVHQSPDT